MLTWVEKYKPNNIDEFALDTNFKKTFKQYIKNGTIPNMLLVGSAGIGKSSLANVLPTLLDDPTTLYINASADNGVDTVRNKVSEFVSSKGWGGHKILILDEADGLTTAGQRALRNIMETDLQNTSFILTCNYPDKIIAPLKSRCPEINLKCSVASVLARMVDILKQEKVKLTKEDAVHVKSIVHKYYPDIRKTLTILERSFVSGSYTEVAFNSSETTYCLLDNLLSSCKNDTEIRTNREYWIQHESEFDSDYSKLGSALFNKIESNPRYNSNAILLIRLATHLYQLDNAVDKEIQFYCMVLELINEENF